jgi:hypothetical protein
VLGQRIADPTVGEVPVGSMYYNTQFGRIRGLTSFGWRFLDQA